MRVGVLIIGSLLWQRDPVRSQWRDARLLLEERQQVRASIGYRKRSKSWHCAFTMTFRQDASNGTAVLVPCREPVNDNQALLREAQELWRAESRSITIGPIAASWGCVGAAFQSPEAPEVQEWRNCFRERVGAGAIAPVDDAGILTIPWPVRTEDSAPADFDVILATATKASLSVPDARVIADAWLEQSNGAEEYFFENVGSGIRTSEDVDIWSHIESTGAKWLTNSQYAAAIESLQTELDASRRSKQDKSAVARLRWLFAKLLGRDNSHVRGRS